MIDINSKNMGINTRYCSDSMGNSEFKCECHEGFEGTRCENECPSEILVSCKDYETCRSEIDKTTSIQKWKCSFCEDANPCCESGPTPLCCQNGVCSNENFVFNGTNANECQCICTDNFAGLFN